MRAGRIPAGPAFAVTPALREDYASGDDEELEYAALLLAAKASLRLLAADPAAPPRRVVLAAEVSISACAPATEPGAVELTRPVPLSDVVSAHVDDIEAEPDIRAAIQALPAADDGDDDALFTVDGAEGHELGWYATQEFPDLVA